ncbi:MAG: beta-ketoacyl-ACP synthase III [Maricaulaceae bacterium]|nr:beta-ketoacyl-ACP synthase III [Maricaulaceae bacterium]
MSAAVIRATGLWTPPQSISNEALVASYNAYVERWNAGNADRIAAGEVEAKLPSSVEFIEKASGIKARYAIDPDGILDAGRLRPRVAPRPDEELCLMAEAGVNAAKDALDSAGLSGADVDGVICSATSMQRTYPCIAIEIQDAIGAQGFGFDMSVACSSATFALQNAVSLIAAGQAQRILVVTPEITTPQLNYTDRDSHFIFGDVAVAAIIEREGLSPGGWRILSVRAKTQYANTIRSNQGFLNRCEEPARDEDEMLFVQQGRRVFKEVCPWVSDLILAHMADIGLSPADMKRLWLHQANINMNRVVASRVFGRDFADHEAPTILDEYANTAGAGAMVCFHKHSDGFQPGEKGLICSFGAGYSAGSVFIERRAA